MMRSSWCKRESVKYVVKYKGDGCSKAKEQAVSLSKGTISPLFVTAVLIAFYGFQSLLWYTHLRSVDLSQTNHLYFSRGCSLKITG